jgi:uncharacterized protein (TIGR00255 family)
MLRSMTGFGASSAEEGDFALRVETRSVNHRHLQVKSRLSGDFSFLEGDVERLVKKRLERGSVSVYLSSSCSSPDIAVLDVEAAARYRAQLDDLARRLSLDRALSLDALVGLPGVVTHRENGEARAEALGSRVLKLIDEAIGRLVEMREAEGRSLEEDLRKNGTAIERIVARIERRMPQVVREHQRTLRRRVTDLLENRQGLSQTDLAREIALLADRLDVSEEIARLKSHLTQLVEFLDRGGAIGRKLDFLVQEIFREVNTIGSKCSDATVTHWVVEAKTLVERLREQVQNVE